MLLPYASDRPPRTPPLAVVSLVLAHFGAFGLVALLISVRGSQAAVVWYVNLSLVPGTLHWYSFLTYAFLHEDVFHLSANMLFLWVFGGSVEEALRWRRFLLFYFMAAVVTGGLQVAVTFALPGADRMVPIVGASGAVAAVVGVFAVRFYRSTIRFIGLPVRVPAVVLLAAAVLLEMGAALWQIGQSGGVGLSAAHWAHIGGFFLGLAFSQATRQMAHGRQEYMAADAAQDMERGAASSAARRWEAVLRAEPNNMDAEAELGRAWHLLGDRTQSLTHYRRAIDVLLKQGRKADAARRYTEMIAAWPDAPIPPTDLFAIAGTLEEQGNFDAAVRAFDRIASSTPDTREGEMSGLRSGILYLNRLDQPARAAERLGRFLHRYPNSEWKSYAQDLLKTATDRIPPA
jgi:membrane associated rhomboid family serine protease